MRSLAALGLILFAACEARAPEPSAAQPSKQSTQAEAPATVEPRPQARSNNAPISRQEPSRQEPAPQELPAVAGVHYLEIVTGDADPNSELPMIIAIHGLGDSPKGFSGLLARFDRPARVILPRALDAHEPGWSWFPLRARDNDVESLARGIKHAADTLAPVIKQLSEQRPTDGKPIVTGFSQGGMLAFTLAIHHGELFSAAFPVGGWMPPPLMPTADADPKKSPPIVAFHGDADRAVAFEPTAAMVRELQRAGYKVELNAYAGVGHAIPEAMHAELLSNLREAVAEVGDSH